MAANIQAMRPYVPPMAEHSTSSKVVLKKKSLDSIYQVRGNAEDRRLCYTIGMQLQESGLYIILKDKLDFFHQINCKQRRQRECER